MSNKSGSMGARIEDPVCGVCGAGTGAGCSEVPCDPVTAAELIASGVVGAAFGTDGPEFVTSYVPGPPCAGCGLGLVGITPTDWSCASEACPEVGKLVSGDLSGVYPVFSR